MDKSRGRPVQYLFVLLIFALIGAQVSCTMKAQISDLSPSIGNQDGASGNFQYSVKSYYIANENIVLSPEQALDFSEFEINPDLPAGLSLNADTGVISGAATEPSIQKSFTIQAVRSNGERISQNISFEIARRFIVNQAVDLADKNLNDGTCFGESGATNGCSIRAAMDEVNSTPSDILTIISIPVGNYLLLGTGLNLLKRANIVGEGSSGVHIEPKPSHNIFPILKVGSLSSFSISGVTLGGGTYTGGAANDVVPGVGMQSQAGDLYLDDVIIENNGLPAPNRVAMGIGLSHSSGGVVSIKNSKFINNKYIDTPKTSTGGGLYILAKEALLDGVTIDGNGFSTTSGSSEGGGAYIIAETGVLKGLTLNGNFARLKASGLYLSNGNFEISDSQFESDSGPLTIFGNELYLENVPSVKIKNTSIEQPTGQQVIRVGPGTLLLAENCTFEVGGILFDINNSFAHMKFSTLTATGSPFYFRGTNTTGKVSFQTSILNFSTPYQVGSTNPVFESLGFNVYTIGNNGPADGVMSTDILNTDPRLGTLSNNGGKGKTRSINSNSPALNLVPDYLCLPKDQRGMSRVTSSQCDAGAFEY